MKIYSVAKFAIIALFLFLVGCASTPPQKQAEPQTTSGDVAKPQDSEDSKATMPGAPTSTEIKDLTNRLQAHPATLYSVANNTYSLYLGGQFTATYHAADGSLEMRDDTDTVNCHFDANGKLQAKAGKNGVCTQWLQTLGTQLNPPTGR